MRALQEGVRAAHRRQVEEWNRRLQTKMEAERLSRHGIEDDEETRLAREMGL